MIQEVDGMMMEGNATKFCGIALKLGEGDTVQFELDDDKSGTFFFVSKMLCHCHKLFKDSYLEI